MVIMQRLIRHIVSGRLPVLLAVLAMTGLGASAMAADDQSLKELRARQAEEQRLQREASFTGNVCNTRISARINWGASSNWPSGRSLAAACDGALSAVEALCRDGKASQVRDKIKSFQCSGDGSGPSLSGSTLRYGASPGRNGFGATKSYLERRLK